MTRPTKTQAALIRYLDGGPVPTTSVKQPTYDVCSSRGWIEPIDEFPFHRTTPAGRSTLGASKASGSDQTRAATEARRRAGDTKRAEILRSHGWTCTPPE